MDYVATNAKIKVMHGRLLKYNDYDILSRLSSINEVGIKLKEYKEYKIAIESLEGSAIHRELLERRISLSMMNDYQRIIQFITDHNIRKFLNAYFLKNEIFVLKMLLGIICDERRDRFDVSEIGSVITNKTSLDAGKLLESGNIGEFIENLSGTIYYSVLANIYREDTRVFNLEMHLDLFYFMNLWEASQKYLTKKERKGITPIIGTMIDMHNIMWIYRFKKFYTLNPSIIYSYLIPIEYILKAKDINMMVEAESIETGNQLREILIKAYKDVFKDSSDTLEYDYYEKMAKVFAKVRRDSPNSLASVVAFLFEKELEINNITSLIEGIRYGLSSKDIMKHLNFIKRTEAS